MRQRKWMAFGVALGMIAATGGWLAGVAGRVKLGKPGVKVAPDALYQADGTLVSNRCVILPDEVPGFHCQKGGPTQTELTDLPADTTFGRNLYSNADLDVQLTVVLMGTDHTSIHQPEYCLTGQDWTITNEERIVLHIKRPYPYDLPAVKISASQVTPSGKIWHCSYVYWFVSGDKITADEGSRLRSMWKNVLERGVVERWAYISYFAPCLPGRESDSFRELQKFIEATAPDIQTVTGERVDSAGTGAEK